MAPERTLVLNANGIVLGVEGAPADWTGTRLEERTDVPDDVRRAVADARSRFSSGATPPSVTDANSQAAQPVRVIVLFGPARPSRRHGPARLARIDHQCHEAAGPRRRCRADARREPGCSANNRPGSGEDGLGDHRARRQRAAVRPTRHPPDAGGAIVVRARYEPTASQVVLEVQDDGSGIPKDKVPQLLRRSAAQLHAAGLALSLVQDVIAAHGGTVQIESSTEADRSGTTVRLTLSSP